MSFDDVCKALENLIEAAETAAVSMSDAGAPWGDQKQLAAAVDEAKKARVSRRPHRAASMRSLADAMLRPDEGGCLTCGRPMTNDDMNEQQLHCVPCRTC